MQSKTVTGLKIIALIFAAALAFEDRGTFVPVSPAHAEQAQSAPRTCGEITDLDVAIAMGCVRDGTDAATGNSYSAILTCGSTTDGDPAVAMSCIWKPGTPVPPLPGNGGAPGRSTDSAMLICQPAMDGVPAVPMNCEWEPGTGAPTVPEYVDTSVISTISVLLLCGPITDGVPAVPMNCEWKSYGMPLPGTGTSASVLAFGAFIDIAITVTDSRGTESDLPATAPVELGPETHPVFVTTGDRGNSAPNAPSTCGEITDPEVAFAMGCITEPILCNPAQGNFVRAGMDCTANDNSENGRPVNGFNANAPDSIIQGSEPNNEYRIPNRNEIGPAQIGEYGESIFGRTPGPPGQQGGSNMPGVPGAAPN